METNLILELSVSGTITQNIEILTGETPEQFKEKLKKGEYLTTLGSSKRVIEIPSMKLVGTIWEQEPTDSIELEIVEDEE